MGRPQPHYVVRIARFSMGVFWLVLPSLALFALLPTLVTRWKLSFLLALGIACSATVMAYLVMAALLKKAGVEI
jgi:hypothetical protein